MANEKTQTLGQRLKAIEDGISALFDAGDVQGVKNLQATIKSLDEWAGRLRKTHDKSWDLIVDQAFAGQELADKFTAGEVKRMRKPTETKATAAKIDNMVSLDL